MSCRALGRKVEEAVLADIVALARAFGAQRLICEYIATEKNALVRELYPRTRIDRDQSQRRERVYELLLDDACLGTGVEFIKMLQSPAPVEALVGEPHGREDVADHVS